MTDSWSLDTSSSFRLCHTSSIFQGYTFFFPTIIHILCIMVGRKFLALVNSFGWEIIKKHLKRAPLGLGALEKGCLDTSGQSTHIWSKIRPRLLLTFCSHIPLWQFHFRIKCSPPFGLCPCPNLALSWLPTSPVRLPQVTVWVYWRWIPGLLLTSSVSATCSLTSPSSSALLRNASRLPWLPARAFD